MIDDKLREILREYKKKPITYLVDEEDKALSAIKAALLEKLPKKREHLSGCTYKKRYGHGCNCGAEEHNQAVEEMKKILR